MRLCVAPLLVILFFSASAAADPPAACHEDNAPSDTRISACTSFLQQDGLSNDDRMIAYFSRGESFRKKFQRERALADFNLALKWADHPVLRSLILNARGIAWQEKGDFDNALADFDEFIRMNPKAPQPLLNRGVIWVEKENYDKAIADYNRVVILEPDLPEVYNNRGVAYSKKGELEKAIDDLSTAINLDPKHYKSYATLGAVWRQRGNLDKAVLEQNRAIQLSPASESTYLLVARSETFRYLGRYADALADCEKALRIQPSYIPALTCQGLNNERMGKLDAASSYFQRAVESKSPSRFQDLSKSSRETAIARLAAYASKLPQPNIPPSLPEATNSRAIPTPTIGELHSATGAEIHAARGRRVALVVGNSAYQNIAALANPRKDAAAIALSLKNIGFNVVTLANNQTRDQMLSALQNFANEAENSDWAMIYYAGHGMEVGGVNYLIPIDAKIAVDRDVQFEAIPLAQVLNAADTAKKIKLVVLDACRDNPFKPRQTATPAAIAAAGSTAGAPTTTRSSNGRGLAEVKVTGATLVVYAAKDGQVALDGEGDNSPFAVAVVQRLATPGVEINKLFRLVRDDVMEATAGRQEPYTYGSLPGKEDFFFVSR